MLLTLGDATARTCGAKAAVLGALVRAGLPVPAGVVLPFSAQGADDGDLEAAVRRGLAELGHGPVAVRSSASGEDGADGSAAGQHESVLAVQGVGHVVRAIRTCWASLHSDRAVAYRDAGDVNPGAEPAMAVVVQRHLDPEVSGVMFTPGREGGRTEIEASWGLGPSVVGGMVTPDVYRVAGDGDVRSVVGDKRTRLDRRGAGVVSRAVAAADQARPTMDDATARRLALLGHRVAEVLGGPQDVEWAIVQGRVWVLQSRPITASLPSATAAATTTAAVTDATHDPARDAAQGATTLTGMPGSRGVATGPARVVRGAGDFGRVRPGDILVCPWTDPAWTPLLRVVAGVVTETGGALAHAAIVARERGIPAVLGVPDVTRLLDDGATVTVDGDAGLVTRTL